VFFHDWDEGMYAQIATEILKNKSLFTTFNGSVWLDKPPLAHTLIATVFLFFGRSEFWARFLMLIFASATLVLTYFLTKQVLNHLLKTKLERLNRLQKEIAYLIPVFVVSSANIFLDRATLLNTDIIVALSWVGYFLFNSNFALKLLFLSIGVYSKSIFGFYPLFFELLTVKREDFSLKNLKKTFILILIPSLWYIAGLIKYGNYFIQAHIIDQLFKRIVVPIELHSGDKFYYLKYLWENMGILAFVLIPSYLMIFFDFIKNFKREGLKIRTTKKGWYFLILFSALPFYIFLNFGKTKIYWYIAILMPLFAIPISYFYTSLNSKILRYAVVIIILIYFLATFLPQTYNFVLNYQVPERITLARCISKLPGTRMGFLVDQGERSNRNFLEAAHYQTSSSFFYGGSPSFVYYLNKKVDYFYDVVQFLQNYPKYNIIAVSSGDVEKIKELESIKKDYKKNCVSGSWETLIK
jgi:4-amino-4-deoxy-L-arabinose transferase-like glycosyltransferase